MMTPLAWAILLLIFGLGLGALEVVFPSAGLLGIGSAVAILCAIILAFQQGPTAGFSVLVTAVVVLPVLLVVALKWWPETAIGRRVLLGIPTDEDTLPDTPRRRTLENLIGQVGTAKTKMLPAGAAVFDGQTIDAISEGAPIEPGQTIRVVNVRSNRVVVRAVDEPLSPSTPLSPDDPLSQPIDSIASDPFDEPPE